MITHNDKENAFNFKLKSVHINRKNISILNIKARILEDLKNNNYWRSQEFSMGKGLAEASRNLGAKPPASGCKGFRYSFI